MPEISIIIPAHNAAHTLAHCLEALQQQSVARDSYEIIVVDDGSTDATSAIAQRYAVRYYQQTQAGPAAARNLGVQHACGAIVLFTDADCVPTPDWVARMQAPFVQSAVVGVKGTYRSRQTSWVARFVQWEYEDKYDQMKKATTIDFIDTYSAGYRREIFLANGGFDTTFPTAAVEDQEFSFRLAAQGYTMLFVPTAQVYHLGHAATLTAYWKKKFNIGYWKVRVTRRYPEKLWHDSHTPQVLKVQIALVALGIILGMGSLIGPPLLGVSGLVMVLLFLLSILPFTIKILKKDPWVALVAPGLLFIRAAALGLGFGWGVLKNRNPGFS